MTVPSATAAAMACRIVAVLNFAIDGIPLGAVELEDAIDDAQAAAQVRGGVGTAVIASMTWTPLVRASAICETIVVEEVPTRLMVSGRSMLDFKSA